MKLHFLESGIHVLRHQTLALCHCRSAAQNITKAGFDIEDVRHITSQADQSLHEKKRHLLVFEWKILFFTSTISNSTLDPWKSFE